MEYRKPGLIFTLFAFVGFTTTALLSKFLFLRHPARSTPNNNALFISPANGKIISIQPYDFTGQTDPTEQFVQQTKSDGGIIPEIPVKIFTHDVAPAGKVISIMLNLTDVHYQRAPVDSIFITKTYTPGAFQNALSSHPRYQNEHNQILLGAADGSFKYKIVQIAGFFARRIEDYIAIPSPPIKQGAIIGVIKLGSQVTVVIPNSLQVIAKVGDYLIDGETVIAKQF